MHVRLLLITLTMCYISNLFSGSVEKEGIYLDGSLLTAAAYMGLRYHVDLINKTIADRNLPDLRTQLDDAAKTYPISKGTISFFDKYATEMEQKGKQVEPIKIAQKSSPFIGQYLLTQFDINAYDFLIHATKLSFLRGVKELLERGADPDISCELSTGDSALIKASRVADPQMVKEILAYTQNPNIENNNGHTALDVAAMSLKEFSVDFNPKNHGSFKKFMDHIMTISFLIRKNAKVTSNDNAGTIIGAFSNSVNLIIDGVEQLEDRKDRCAIRRTTVFLALTRLKLAPHKLIRQPI